MIKLISPPDNVNRLIEQIAMQYDQLSVQLKRIADYVANRGDHLALEGVRDIALACEVQPSSIIRFAKTFGFSGFSAMQAIFRNGAADRLAAPINYNDRINEFITQAQQGGSAAGKNLSPRDIALSVIADTQNGLSNLASQFVDRDFINFVKYLKDADTIWIASSRRSLAVGAYLAYLLRHTNKTIHWLNGVGFMQKEQMNSMKKKDALIAISFAPYATETLAMAQDAQDYGAHILAMTDSALSPLARLSKVSLVIQESASFGFRSLTNTMSMAQALFMALAYQSQLVESQST